MNRWMRGLLGFSICLILGISQAYAVALGKIEVASHLGEAFFAEVPMQLEENESISSVFVELAAPADYRILEVYRDPALNAIRSDVKKDSRGARVELSSNSVIDAPFFNLVLKVRYGHATQFKKYPIFLDLPQAKPVQIKALPTLSTINPQADAKQETQPKRPASAVSAAEPEAQDSTKPVFKSYDGWARTGRYGPMVYGDTISTVARRLRVDERYTLQQVMMALFNKNKKKFSQGNVNLIQAGTYLDVPQASEVEDMTPSQAKSLLAQHNQRWNTLKKQPRYAAVAEAQKNRYKARVRVGKSANGVASAPVPGKGAKEKSGMETDGGKVAGTGTSATVVTPETTEPKQQAKLDALQQENAALQEKLKTADDKIDALSGKLANADVVAANARIKKLELSLARLQAELDRSRQEVKPGGGASQWLTYLLAGLVILLLGGVGYLLRRERPHPAVASTAASAAAVDSSLAAPSLEDEVQEFEEVIPEVPVAEEPAEEMGQATKQMSTQEFEDAFTDSVPDLTESDTAEMEALQEAVEEEPDPNVDYMAEAGVYLRYGMEDEAIGQIRMAIKQRPDNADAYSKLVQTLQSKGDQEELDAAIEAGRAVLSGEGLQAFEAAVSSEGQEEAEIDLGDTLPPTGIEAVDFSETGETEQEESTEDQDTLVLGQAIGAWEGESPEDQGEQTEENTLTEEVVLPDETTIGREEAEVPISEESVSGAETGEQEETEGEDILEMSDLEMGDLDWDTQSAAGEEKAQETVVESAPGEAAESADVTEPESGSGEAVEPAAASEPDQIEAIDTLENEIPEPDLDLSEIDIPDVSDVVGSAASADVETSDLDKTIAIDWSGETEALEEITGGFSVDVEESAENEPSGESEAAADEEPDSEQKEAEEQSVEKPFNPQSSGVLDIGLDEVEMNEAEPPSSDDVDEFTSTVRMTVDTDKAEEFPDIGLESVELEASVETDAASTDAPVESGEAAGEPREASENIETETLDPGIEDGDITHELDGLLTELDMDTEAALDTDTSPDSLNIDKARSLLAEGALDEAESSFKAAADAGDKRGDGLLGLAEVAQQRGDADKTAELLAEAEALVDDSNREWFESIKSKQD